MVFSTPLPIGNCRGFLPGFLGSCPPAFHGFFGIPALGARFPLWAQNPGVDPWVFGLIFGGPFMVFLTVRDLGRFGGIRPMRAPGLPAYLADFAFGFEPVFHGLFGSRRPSFGPSQCCQLFEDFAIRIPAVPRILGNFRRSPRAPSTANLENLKQRRD